MQETLSVWSALTNTSAKRKHMMTSIINHSNGWITDERPPEAVRAINRRAVEDPEPRYA